MVGRYLTMPPVLLISPILLVVMDKDRESVGQVRRIHSMAAVKAEIDCLLGKVLLFGHGNKPIASMRVCPDLSGLGWLGRDGPS